MSFEPNYKGEVMRQIATIKRDGREPSVILVDYGTLMEIRTDVNNDWTPREYLEDAYEAPNSKYLGYDIVVIDNNNIEYVKVI